MAHAGVLVVVSTAAGTGESDILRLPDQYINHILLVSLVERLERAPSAWMIDVVAQVKQGEPIREVGFQVRQ